MTDVEALKKKIIGASVFHCTWNKTGTVVRFAVNSFGTGKVYIIVAFDGVEKKMAFPDAFSDGFLYLEDSLLYQELSEYLDELKRAEEERIRKAENGTAKNNVCDYLINERGVKSLFHFTPVANLQWILKEGILPVEDTKGKEGVIYPDPHRLDGMLDCSCLSFSWPNNFVLNTKRREMGIHFAILEIDVRALNSDFVDKIYCTKSNAAHWTYYSIRNYGETVNAAADMFSDWFSIGARNYCRKPGTPSEYPTDIQAELLVHGKIDISYVRRIDFESSYDIEAVRKRFEAPENIVFTVGELFKDREYLAEVKY